MGECADKGVCKYPRRKWFNIKIICKFVYQHIRTLILYGPKIR